jgi:hypothetical protein
MKKNLQNLKINQAFAISILFLILGFSAKAQSDYAFWSGNNDAPGYYAPTTVAGNLTADSVRFAQAGSIYGSIMKGTVMAGSYLYGNGSWTNNIVGDVEIGKKHTRFDFQNTYPGQTGPGWPAGATDTLAGVWIQYRVTPNAGYKFTVKSVSFDVCGSGSGQMRTRAFISTSATFKTSTEIMPLSVLASYVFTSVSKTDLNVVVDAGKTFYLRVYPWMADITAPTPGKRIIVRDVKISGITEVSTGILKPTVSSPLAYPNPATDRLIVSNASAITRFEIISVNGMIVNKAFNNNNDLLDINVSGLAKGLYILNVYSLKGSERIKFLKN